MRRSAASRPGPIPRWAATSRSATSWPRPYRARAWCCTICWVSASGAMSWPAARESGAGGGRIACRGLVRQPGAQRKEPGDQAGGGGALKRTAWVDTGIGRQGKARCKACLSFSGRLHGIHAPWRSRMAGSRRCAVIPHEIPDGRVPDAIASPGLREAAYTNAVPGRRGAKRGPRLSGTSCTNAFPTLSRPTGLRSRMGRVPDAARPRRKIPDGRDPDAVASPGLREAAYT
jgi:hypothetical protein